MNKQSTTPLIHLVKLAGRVSVLLFLMLSVMGGVTQAAGPTGTAPDWGVAESFAVLGGQTVTNTGPSVVTGNLGVSPGTAIPGFPPGIVVGTIHVADAVAAQAQADVTTAYNDLAGQACDTVLTGQNLGGMTLSAGVYCFSSSAQLTGDLTLDAQGDPDAVWIFQIGSTLISSTASSVQVINGASACNVFWQVGSSATLGTGTAFRGTIAALSSITMQTSTTSIGRAMARNGAVTMDSNAVTLPTCTGPTPTPTTPPPTATSIPPTATPTGTIVLSSTPTLPPMPTATPTVFQVPPTAIELGTFTGTPSTMMVPMIVAAGMLVLSGLILLRRR